MSSAVDMAIFLVLFFALAGLSQWRGIPERLWCHPMVFALSFMGVSGVLTFFGTIELVGRYGIAGLFGLFAFVGVFILSPLFIDPLRWISRSFAFATLPDLFVYRFRNPVTAKATALLMVLASLPLATAQLNALATLLPTPEQRWLPAIITMVAATFVALFSDPRRSTRAIPGVSAAATMLALIAVLCCAGVAIQQVFGGVTPFNQWAESSNQDQLIMRFDKAYALVLLFLPMAFILPQQGFMQTLSNWWPRHSPSAWMIPFVSLLATLPIFPVLWSGLFLKLDVPFQQYFAVLPSVLAIPWLHSLTMVAILFVAVSMLIVTAIALSKILVTCFLIDKNTRFQDQDLDVWINRRRIILGCAWLFAVLLASLHNRSSSVTDLSISGMTGMIQLLPGVIATLYAPKINHKGFLAGLAVGTAFWLYGIAVPIYFDTQAPQIFGMNVATGPENWPFWLLESLVANLLVALAVSMLTKMSTDEKIHAFHCMVDNLPTPQRQSLEITTVDAIVGKLAQRLGEPAARREIAAALGNLSISMDDHRPLALRLLRDRLSFQLSAKLGTLTAERVMEEVMPFGEGPAVDDISLVESQLAGAGNALSGLAAELNKLRLYHRRTLEHLPIGVCSLDSEGEILLWNLTMARYTGIGASTAEGANIEDLPSPWGITLANFCASSDIIWTAHEIEHRGVGWYNLNRYRVEENSPVYAGYQVVLLEDITERVKLVQELAHSERLTSVGRLAAGVAHEIGNPVTGISCLAQDLLAESQEEETAKSAKIILDLTERITTIVRTLMDFSRGDSHNSLKPMPLQQAVDNAVQLLLLDKGAKTVEFRATIAEDFVVQGDLHQLTQVFVNLLANARDASAPGDVIDISAQSDQGGTILIHVTDEGQGIPDEFQPRVMDPFFTTKEPGEGTGLGLSLVFSIIRAHKGSVKITSPVQDGRGTRITLTLRTP